MITSRSKRFVSFLNDGGDCLLTPRLSRIARLISEGKPFEEIGREFDVTRERISQLANKVDRAIKGAEREARKRADFNLLVILFKGKPLEEVPINGFFPIRLQNALFNSGISTLADIVQKGRIGLWRKRGISEAGLKKVDEVLILFGSKLPEDKYRRNLRDPDDPIFDYEDDDLEGSRFDPDCEDDPM